MLWSKPIIIINILIYKKNVRAVLTGIRTSWDLDISVLNICDISVLDTGHLGTE